MMGMVGSWKLDRHFYKFDQFPMSASQRRKIDIACLQLETNQPALRIKSDDILSLFLWPVRGEM
jgi:hypothetical protein